jgi:tetratricopeptide (TPR) repeat protein
MFLLRRRSVSVLILLVGLPALAAAQQKSAVLRPRLPAGSDSNDVSTLMQYGNQMLRDKPTEAIRAFHWAARLDPANAAAFAGERAARLHDDLGMRRKYLLSQQTQGREFRAVDSLEQAARMRDPFYGPAHDYKLLQRWIVEENPNEPIGDLLFSVETELAKGGPTSRAWLAYVKGDHTTALIQYARAMKEDPGTRWWIRPIRARLFAAVGLPDSAMAEFERAINEPMTAKEKAEEAKARDRLTVLYQPQSFFNFSIGLVEEQRGRLADSRLRYEKALEEDLSFWPAALRLGAVQIAQGDTSSGINTLSLAAQAHQALPFVQFTYALALLRTGRAAEAIAPLQAAITADPEFAAPYYALAVLYDRAEMTSEAITAYERYLAHAPQRAPERVTASERLSSLRPK